MIKANMSLKERKFKQVPTLKSIILKDSKLWVCIDCCQKQNIISSLLYCNILMQGLSSSFLFFLFKLRIAPFTELLLKPGPRPWSWPLKNLDPEKAGIRKTWTLKYSCM